MIDRGFTAADIDTSRPHTARMYNYFLGGQDNYAIDREAADAVLRVAPEARDIARHNRAFLQRAVRYLVSDCGIRQIIDVGTGTCSSYCVPFSRLSGFGGPGGAFAAGLLGFGREGDGPAACVSAAGGQVPGFDPCVHGAAGNADAVGYLPGGELAVAERGGGGDVVVVAEVGG